MGNLRRLLVVCFGLVVVGGGHQLTATETLFAGTPVYSVMETVDTQLPLVRAGDNAFTPRNIPCPAAAGPNGCTFRVTVSTVVGSSSSNAFLQVTTAPFMTISPSPVIPIQVVAHTEAPFTMQWVIKNVPAGSSPEVQVIGGLLSSVGSASFVQRTLSIDVFYGLV
jgi:hypothetical protein